MERSNEKLIAAFAEALKRRRKAAGFSQEELAFRVGISTSYVSLLETRNRQPTLSILHAIAEQLGSTISDFLLEVEKKIQRHGKNVGFEPIVTYAA